MNDNTQWTLPPAFPEEYLGRDRHFTLRKLTISSAKDCDLFGTLFYCYYYCMAQCCDEIGYAWFHEEIYNAEQGNAIRDLEETNLQHFDALKGAAFDYYHIAPEKQRRNVRNLLQKIGWKLDDVFEKHFSLACEVIEWYEKKGIYYVYDLIDYVSIYSADNGFDMANVKIFNFIHHKIHNLAYWCSVFSMNENCLDDSWQTQKKGKELYDFLLGVANHPDMIVVREKEILLDIVRMALKAMKPFVESPNWLNMTGNNNHKTI